MSLNYELIPTTDRKADFVATRHGFQDAATLAQSLPEEANVLDVGAGASPFGRTIAALRPDVRWTNLDYSYRDEAFLAELSQDAPDNLRYMFDDATQLQEQFEPESFDNVFSFWLMPHLSLYAPEPALAVAKGMHDLAKQGALLSVGPKAKHTPAILSRKGVQVVKDETMDADVFAEYILDRTRLPMTERFLTRTLMEVATPTLGTTRWATFDTFPPKIYHQETNTYVPLHSTEGLQKMGQLVVATGVHFMPDEIKSKFSKNTPQSGQAE